jgi:hypothetical protein
MMKVLMTVLACAALGGCVESAPAPTTAADANDAACTAQGDAIYNANTVDQQARTGQTGLLFGTTPNHVFDAEQLGAQHQRESEISNCEQNGSNASPNQDYGAPLVTPHIINSP